MLGWRLLAKPLTVRQSPIIAAATRDTTTLPNSYSEEQISVSDSSDPALIHEPAEHGENGEETDDVRGLDDQKMTKVCDKLIEVFLVDKTTPTDWRRLLAFSREWDNIQSHFYKRCRDRADIEDNPEMKHKLLRLARKLKEVNLAAFDLLNCYWLPNMFFFSVGAYFFCAQALFQK